MSYKVPVLFITFNRLDTSRQVFEAIKSQQPQKLYLFSDGPRKDKQGEANAVYEVRNWLTSQINWPCDVHTLFLDQNMGPRYALGHAVNWLFAHEEEGVIFEHDCLPHPSFFPFCAELLERYRNEPRVMYISGNNFMFNEVTFQHSYSFSRHNHIWGFATWRRAWQKYDPEMTGFEEAFSSHFFDKLIPDSRIRKEYITILNAVKLGTVDTWDYQWFFNTWCAGGVGVIPSQNLVSNIGYGALALNTFRDNHILANIPVNDIGSVISHPEEITTNKEIERVYLKRVFPPFLVRVRLINKILRKLGYNV